MSAELEQCLELASREPRLSAKEYADNVALLLYPSDVSSKERFSQQIQENIERRPGGVVKFIGESHANDKKHAADSFAKKVSVLESGFRRR